MAHLVGKRIEVYWDGDARFYKGRVARYAPRTGRHEVAYDDDETEWLRLDRARHRFVDGGGSRYTIEWEWADEKAQGAHAAAVAQLVAAVGATPQVASTYLDAHGSPEAAAERYLRDRDGDRPRRAARGAAPKREPATPPRRPAKRRRADKGAAAGTKATVDDDEAAPLVQGVDDEWADWRGCVCGGSYYGEMVACEGGCDNWFHFACVGLTRLPRGEWLCQDCKTKKKPKKRRVEKQTEPLPPPPAEATAGDAALARRLAADARPLRRGRSATQPKAEDAGWCICGGSGEGAMVRCDDASCALGRGWFHFTCVGLAEEPRGRWLCPECRPAAPVQKRRRERHCWCDRPDDGRPMVECSIGNCPRPWHHFACVGLANEVPDNWACAACERSSETRVRSAIVECGRDLVKRAAVEFARRSCGAALADVVYTVHRGRAGGCRWRAPERDDAEIGDRAAARECLTALLWAASLRGTPPGPAFDAEVGSFARVARLGPHRHSQRPAPLKAVVRSPRGLVLFRAPSDYAAAFGVTCHAREHFLQLQGAAPRTTSSSRRALQVRPAFPDAARAPPSDLTMRFLDMLRARDSIRIQKAAGAPWPWSGDDVLNRHKFTNVKREHDRVTAWLRAHWTSAHSDADAATVLFNCGVFRTFGTVAFAEALGWTHSLKDWDAGKARAAAVACWRGGRHAFTRAYCRPRFNAERRRGDAGARPPVDVYDGAIRILAALRGECHNVMDRGGSWRAVCTRLRRVAGFGGSGFMAKEVLHDAMGWASVRALVRDAGDWTPPGPGARRGLNRLHGRALDLGALAPADSPGEARFIKEMGLLLGALRDSDRAFCSSLELDIHDVQFQLCEYDKYCRAAGEGRGHVPPYRPCAALFAGGAAPPGLELRPLSEEWHALRPARPASPTDEAATSRDGDDDDLDPMEV